MKFGKNPSRGLEVLKSSLLPDVGKQIPDNYGSPDILRIKNSN